MVDSYLPYQRLFASEYAGRWGPKKENKHVPKQALESS